MYEYIEECTTYDTAIATLKNLYTKVPNEVFARHLLATAKQNPGETLDEFLLSLQKLAKDCNFRAVSSVQYKQEMVRDAFINGLLSCGIRQRLLEHHELNLETAIEKARAMELAQKNSEFYARTEVPQRSSLSAAVMNEPHCEAKELRDKSGVELSSTPDVASETASSVSKLCSYCGRSYHSRNTCPAKNAVCFKCQKKGHFANVCKSKIVKNINSSVYSSSLCAIHNTPDCLTRASLIAVIANTKVSALIDTGSSMSFINDNTAKRLRVRIMPCNESISMASHTLTENVYGCCVVDVCVNGSVYRDVNLKVLRNLCCDILLGQDFQSQHKQVIFQYEGKKKDFVVSQTCALASAAADTPSLFHNLSRDCKPIAIKSRRFNAIDQEFIDNEIRRLNSEGIIKPSISPWRAQIVVVKNAENNKRRMCVDYSQTINLFTELDAYPLPKIEFLVNELAKFHVFSTFDLRSAYHQIPISKKDRLFTAFEACGKLWEFTRIPFGVTNGVPAFQREMDNLVLDESLKDTFPYLDNITVAGRTQKEHDFNVKQLLDALQRRNWTLNDSKTIASVSSINILGYLVGNGKIKPDPERLRPLRELPPPTNSKSLKRVLGLFAYYAKWIYQFSDKIYRLKQTTSFPLDNSVLAEFENIKKEIEQASLQSVDESIPFVVECDASEVAISATLNQGGRPIAFMSRSFQGSELHYPAVEKEATAIIEAVRKWNHFLSRQHFTLVTDQRSVSFMLDNRKRTKIKNNKIQCWRLELSSYSYTILYRPGKDNAATDSLTRAHCNAISSSNLPEIHDALCHPGVARLLHFVRTKN